MRRALFSAVFVGMCCAAFNGCIKAPLELQTAVKRQHQDLAQIRVFYGDAINKLFDEIEALQLHYIDEFELVMTNKYKFKKGQNPGTVAPDDDLNVISVPIQARIHRSADERRTLVRKNILAMRKQYLVLNQSIDNADAINQDIGAYVDSLIKYRKAQDALGQALLQKVNSLTPVTLPAATTLGGLLKTFEAEFDNPAQESPSTEPTTKSEK